MKRRESNPVNQQYLADDKTLGEADEGAAQRVEDAKEQDRSGVFEEHRHELAGEDHSAKDDAKGDDLRRIGVVYGHVDVLGEIGIEEPGESYGKNRAEDRYDFADEAGVEGSVSKPHEDGEDYCVNPVQRAPPGGCPYVVIGHCLQNLLPAAISHPAKAGRV